MGILDSLKGLVIEQVEVPDVPKSTSLNPTKSFSTPPPLPSSVIVNASDVSEIDAAIKTKFEEALQSKIPPLYTELNDTVNMLADDIPNVSSRYKAALKILGKRGATSQSIIGAFDLCIQILDTKFQDFQTSAANKIVEKIDKKKASVDQIDKTIETMNVEASNLQLKIEKIKEEATTLKASRAQIMEEIEKENASIKLKQDRAQVIYQELRNDFDKKKQSLAELIK